MRCSFSTCRLQSWLSTAPRSLCWRRPRDPKRKKPSHGTARWVSTTRHVNHFIAMDQARWINPRIFMPGCRSGGESDEDKGTAAERQEVWACSGRLLPFPLVLLFLLRQRERPRAQRGEQHPQRRAADAGLEQPPSGGGATHRGREEQAAAGQTEGEMRLSGAWPPGQRSYSGICKYGTFGSQNACCGRRCSHP